jgi:hypothetical protein
MLLTMGVYDYALHRMRATKAALYRRTGRAANSVEGVARGAVFFAACACGTGSSASPSDASVGESDGATVAQGDFCGAIATAICGTFLPCCDSLDAGSDPATCTAEVQAWCARGLPPTATYDGTAAAACVAFYQDVTLQGCTITHPATSNACTMVFAGTAPPGAPCASNHVAIATCAPSDAGEPVCDEFADGGSACAILPYIGLGESCSDGQKPCRPPLRCSRSTSVCVQPEALGAACTDPDGCESLNCVGGGCAPTAPRAIDVSFCTTWASSGDGG